MQGMIGESDGRMVSRSPRPAETTSRLADDDSLRTDVETPSGAAARRGDVMLEGSQGVDLPVVRVCHAGAACPDRRTPP